MFFWMIRNVTKVVCQPGESNIILQGTYCPQKDTWDLSCLLQLNLVTRVRLPQFWNNERCIWCIVSIILLFYYLFKNGANDMSEMVDMVNDFFVKKLPIKCTLYHTNH